tara:strand:- start:722 stop:1144 length:423 start_codon:yes stop_codon:yes gene_type:complete
MSSPLFLALVIVFTIVICATVIVGIGWLGEQIKKSNIAILRRMSLEIEFFRLAARLESELGSLCSAHFGLIESFPQGRMKFAILEEQKKYEAARLQLINQYDLKFKEIEDQCDGLCPGLVQGLIELNADAYPSLGLLSKI